MKIDRILSNNAVLALTDKGEECVVLGKGIGFGKKAGDCVDEALIESRFLKTQEDLSAFFADILAEIPPLYLAVTEKIVAMARDALNIDLQDTLFIALSDHINFAVLRHQKGMEIKNPLLWEIRRFYPEEYAVGQRALRLINDTLKLDLPEDEIGFITLHIVNAAGENNMQNVMTGTEIVKNMLNIVKYDLNISWDEHNLNYQRFITHLKFFTQRLLSRDFVAHHQDSLYDDIDRRLAQSWGCALKLSGWVKQNYQHTLTYDEMAFLAIHIERLRKDSVFR
ncbi:MAG TPA: PRD domain-containing protein [Enterobacteriaceae bacterium]|nr:PRD domain-containing protein [Enterobacteriaceae bacterium]